LSRNRRNYSPEFKEEAVRAVIESSRPVAQVAKELGIHEATLGSWVNAYRREHVGDEPPLTVSERARLREQEAELRELRQKVLFLEKVAAYFAKDPR
jgi:transposase